MKLENCMKMIVPIIALTLTLIFTIPSEAGQKLCFTNNCKGGGQSFYIFYWDFFSTSYDHVTPWTYSACRDSYKQSGLAIITAVMYQPAQSAPLEKKTIWAVPYTDIHVVLDERSGKCDIYQKLN